MAVILLIIGITASFLSKPFPSKDIKQKEITTKRSSLKVTWNKIELNLDRLLLNNLIEKKEYLIVKAKNEKSRVLAFRGISKERRKTAIAFSFLGRSSFSFWLKEIGILLCLLTVSIFAINKDRRLKNKGLLKWYEPAAGISFLSVSLFWLYYMLFQTQRDFDLSTYTFYLLLVTIPPLAYFVYHFIRRKGSIEEHLLNNNRILVSHALRHTKDEEQDEMWNVLEKVSKNGK